MNIGNKMKALALLNELQSLLLEDERSNTDGGCLPPEANAYVGTQADRPGFLDLNLDTPEQSEVDALAIYQQGLDKAHNSEIQAWNSGQQAQAYAWQADRSNPMLAAGTTAIGGLTQVGSNFGSKLWGGGSTNYSKDALRATNYIPGRNKSIWSA